jgi:hypothetical protein
VADASGGTRVVGVVGRSPAYELDGAAPGAWAATSAILRRTSFRRRGAGRGS